MSFPHARLSPDVVPTLCGLTLGVVARVVDRVAGDSGLHPELQPGESRGSWTSGAIEDLDAR